MHAGSTLFLDVCAQRDFWSGGPWPIVAEADAARMVELFALAAELAIRQGGVVCRHEPATAGVSHAGPAHCFDADGAARPPGCVPVHPVAVYEPGAAQAGTLDRRHAYYVGSGCMAAPDATTAGRLVLDHLTAGVRDAVVFGAGIEHAVDRIVDALTRRRIRTHVVLDATAAVDPAAAQRIIAEWKRRTVDVLTAATVRRLLKR